MSCHFFPSPSPRGMHGVWSAPDRTASCFWSPSSQSTSLHLCARHVLDPFHLHLLLNVDLCCRTYHLRSDLYMFISFSRDHRYLCNLHSYLCKPSLEIKRFTLFNYIDDNTATPLYFYSSDTWQCTRHVIYIYFKLQFWFIMTLYFRLHLMKSTTIY